MRRPTIEIAVAFNRAVRDDDEWFDEPDDLDRVQGALAAIDEVDDPIDADAVLAYGIARAQVFTEGNERTALLLAKWLLDRNGSDGEQVIPPDDRVLGDLLVRRRRASTSKTPSSRYFEVVAETHRRVERLESGSRDIRLYRSALCSACRGASANSNNEYSLVLLINDIGDPEPARYSVIEHFDTKDIAWRLAGRTIFDPLEHP